MSSLTYFKGNISINIIKSSPNDIENKSDHCSQLTYTTSKDGQIGPKWELSSQNVLKSDLKNQ